LSALVGKHKEVDDMSEKIHLYDATRGDQNAGHNRLLAVEAALELIRAYGQSTSTVTLPQHLMGLDQYADQIQRALEVRQKGS
jgi:hypothetical protein